MKVKRFKLADVLKEEYVDAHGAAELAGITLKTFHNLRSLDRVPFDAFGQLGGIGRFPMIYLRSDATHWAVYR